MLFLLGLFTFRDEQVLHKEKLPLETDQVNFYLRYVFCGIYTLEMFLKILSRGFIFHTYAYLRDAWNWLDFIVVVLG